MKKAIAVMCAVTLLLISGCAGGYEENEMVVSEFCLISDDVIIELNADIAKIDIEPLSVEYGSGDGFKWTINKYEDVEIKTLLSDENINLINKVSTEAPLYKTTRGIKVGDDITKLEKLYNEYLTYSKSPEKTYYVYDPEDDIGFKRIYFYVKNNKISKIIIEDGIDG